jgi:hypothetical protein
MPTQKNNSKNRQSNKVLSLAFRAAEGYLRIFKRIGLLLAALFFIGLSGLIIALPLWFFSVNYSAFYSIGFGAILTVAILVIVVRRVLRSASTHSNIGAFLKASVYPAIRRFLVWIAGIAGLYCCLLLFVYAGLVAGATSLIAYLIIFGLLVFSKRPA